MYFLFVSVVVRQQNIHCTMAHTRIIAKIILCQQNNHEQNYRMKNQTTKNENNENFYTHRLFVHFRAVVCCPSNKHKLRFWRIRREKKKTNLLFIKFSTQTSKFSISISGKYRDTHTNIFFSPSPIKIIHLSRNNLTINMFLNIGLTWDCLKVSILKILQIDDDDDDEEGKINKISYLCMLYIAKDGR